MNAHADSHFDDEGLHAIGQGRFEDGSVVRPREARPDSSAPIVSATAGRSDPAGERRAQPGSGAATLPPGLADHPDYEILRELGRGGMGVVYLARNKLMGRNEVLKVVSGRLVHRVGTLDRFLAEIRHAARLHHPNIVTALAALRIGDDLILAMEHVEGFDLSRVVKAQGPLPVAHACHYVQQVALGLQHAHEHDMVHRDIKPGNLMLTRQGNRPVVKILDFGVARIEREQTPAGAPTQPGDLLGTPAFMAPEQMTDPRRADIRADIYSLGCTLYFLLTGQPPFQGENLYDIFQAHQSMEAIPLNLARPDVPASLAVIVATMMAKEPERRFQTPGEVAQALAPFFRKEGPSPRKSMAEDSSPGASGEFQLSYAGEAAPNPRAMSGRPVSAPEPAAHRPITTGSDLPIAIGPPEDLTGEVHAIRAARKARARLWSAAAGVPALLGIAVYLGMHLEARKNKAADAPTPAPTVPQAKADAPTAPAAPSARTEAQPAPARPAIAAGPKREAAPSRPRPAREPARDRTPPSTALALAHEEAAKAPDRIDAEPAPEAAPAERPPAAGPKPGPEAPLTPEQILEKSGLTKEGRYYVIAREGEYKQVWRNSVQPAINRMVAAYKDCEAAIDVQNTYLMLSDRRDGLRAIVADLRATMASVSRAQQPFIQAQITQNQIDLNNTEANLSQVKNRLPSPPRMRELENIFNQQRQSFLASKDEIEPIYMKMQSEYQALREDERVKGSLNVLGERDKVQYRLEPSEQIQRSVRTLKEYLKMVLDNPDAVRNKKKSPRKKERPKAGMPKVDE